MFCRASRRSQCRFLPQQPGCSTEKWFLNTAQGVPWRRGEEEEKNRQEEREGERLTGIRQESEVTLPDSFTPTELSCRPSRGGAMGAAHWLPLVRREPGRDKIWEVFAFKAQSTILFEAPPTLSFVQSEISWLLG